MDTVQLMALFADPETLHSLTTSQRLTAGLITTMLGMGITFMSLIILQFVIGLMAKFSGVTELASKEIGPQPQQTVATPAPVEEQKNDDQLVAAITVALAVQLGTAASNIVIRNIKKVEDNSSAWNKVGLAELMNNNS